MASVGVSADELAGMLYDSIHQKLLALPDATLVYPGHGAGSACGKHLSQERVSTIGVQRQYNYALQPMSKERFVQVITADQPAAPPYFAHDAELNRRERATLDTVLARELRRLSLAEVLDGPAGRRADPRRAGAGGLRGRSPGRQPQHQPGGRFAEWAGILLVADAPHRAGHGARPRARGGHPARTRGIRLGGGLPGRRHRGRQEPARPRAARGARDGGGAPGAPAGRAPSDPRRPHRDGMAERVDPRQRQRPASRAPGAARRRAGGAADRRPLPERAPVVHRGRACSRSSGAPAWSIWWAGSSRGRSRPSPWPAAPPVGAVIGPPRSARRARSRGRAASGRGRPGRARPSPARAPRPAPRGAPGAWSARSA